MNISEYRKRISCLFRQAFETRDASVNVSEMPLLILIFAVTAIIAVITFAYIYTALPPLTGTANTTVKAFATNFYSGIQLLGVTLIVMAAVSIIGVVLWLRSRGQ